jgi:hypothetical protein
MADDTDFYSEELNTTNSLVETEENDLSWLFANLDLSSDHCGDERTNRQPNHVSARKSSTRWTKLIRITTGEKTHVQILNSNDSNYSGKSALTLYLEEKNAMYEENVAKAFAQRNPLPEPEDLLLKEHRKQIAAVKSAIRIRWISEQAKLKIIPNDVDYINKYMSKTVVKCVIESK